MAEKTLLRSLKSFKDFTDYLEDREFSTKPPLVRWGIVSTSATVFLSFIAFALGLFAIWLTVFYSGGKMVTVILWVLAVIMGLFAIVGLVGLVFIVLLGRHWLKNPYESNIDIIIRGIVKGVIGKDIPKEDVPKETENFGIQIGKKVAKLLKEKEKGKSNAKTRATKKDSKA